PAGGDWCNRAANGMFAPRLVVAEFDGFCLSAWVDPGPSQDNIRVDHDPRSDAIAFEFADLALRPAQVPTLRIGLFPTWLDAVKRYRQRIEQIGAKPLWENDVSWVRGIHAVCTTYPRTKADAFYAGL